jgi:hypothetical protein
MLLAMLCALQVGQACAQANPGDIIVERKITPRIAYDHVPTQDDPVQVRATTFPAGTFDRAMGPLVTDVDLTSAHGSAGVVGNSALMSSLVGTGGTGGLQHMLAGNSVPLGAGAAVGGMGSLGGTISQTVSGALAPLGSALGALK